MIKTKYFNENSNISHIYLFISKNHYFRSKQCISLKNLGSWLKNLNFVF
jgi:hypothetical protein